MLGVVESAIEEIYKDYIFIGRERKKVDENSEGIIDLALSADKNKIKQVFCDLQRADDEMKFFLLDCAMEAFRWSKEDDYQEFRQRVKLMKRERLRNINCGRLVP